MQFIQNKIIAISILIFFSTITFSQSETNWITKKKDKKVLEDKTEKTTSTSWIKKKKKEIKENKKEFKEEEKKITKEVKSWITKKTKDDFIQDVKGLPDNAIYFSGYNEYKDILIYGYVFPDSSSELLENKFYKISKGFAYFNDGKTTCKIGSEVLAVIEGDLTSRVSGKCKNGITFTGKTSQNETSGDGYATASDGNKFFFNFDLNKTKIAKLYDDNSLDTETVTRKLPSRKKQKILLEPNGNYYALLIGNSKYSNGWESLVSPVNDIEAIENVLEKSYKFKQILTVKNGTKKDIYNAFQELSKITTTNDYVLIYYSGHGQVKSEQAYWIPVDGSKDWGQGDWINIMELDIFLREIKAHHLAVLVDSCFVGSKFKGINIIDDVQIRDEKLYGEALSSALDLRSRSVLSSGTSGQVSDTVAGTNNSMFALSLINQLNQFSKESYPLNLEMIASLMKISYRGTFQKPHMYNPDTWKHGGGDFIFIPKGNLK